jgi:1-deoxy-D-xylulose-5-phosphate reductoisomerase
MMKVALFGSTGSVGKMTLEVLEKFPNDFSIHALVAHRSSELLVEQVRKYKPQTVVLYDKAEALKAERILSKQVHFGREGLLRALDSADLMVQSMASTVGIEATIEAAKRGIKIAIANKETIIAAHHLLKPYNPVLCPIDSEHSSLKKLYGNQRPVKTTITGSGGPFLHRPLKEFPTITLKEALIHPNWPMGAHNTINSSTMFNKALEVMEAHSLFGMAPMAVIEPTSRIHAFAEYEDGMTQMVAYQPDMRVPIAHALGVERTLPFPFRKNLDLSKIEFFPIDSERFPLFQLAYEAIKTECGPLFLMFLNEFLVDDFLKGGLGWLDLQHKLQQGFESLPQFSIDSIEAIEELKKITKSIHKCITSTSYTAC